MLASCKWDAHYVVCGRVLCVYCCAVGHRQEMLPGRPIHWMPGQHARRKGEEGEKKRDEEVQRSSEGARCITCWLVLVVGASDDGDLQHM